MQILEWAPTVPPRVEDGRTQVLDQWLHVSYVCSVLGPVACERLLTHTQIHAHTSTSEHRPAVNI